jgi:hypothetical protein
MVSNVAMPHSFKRALCFGGPDHCHLQGQTVIQASKLLRSPPAYVGFFFGLLFNPEEASNVSDPNDGVSTLSWWWGLSAPETLRAMPAVASYW